MKQCRKCLKIREESCFYRKNNICTDCIVEKVRKWRRDNPKKFLETANTRRVKNREKIREYSNNWRDAKKQSGHYGKCIDCGDNLGRNDGFKGKNRNGYCVKCNKGVRHQNFKGGNVGIGTTSPNAGLDMGASNNIRIPVQKSASGVRYVCIDTNGQLTSQAAVCVGT